MQVNKDGKRKETSKIMIPTSTPAICESRSRSASSICSWLFNRSELTRASDSSSALVLLSSSSSLILRASTTSETRQERSSSSVTWSASAPFVTADVAVSTSDGVEKLDESETLWTAYVFFSLMRKISVNSSASVDFTICDNFALT